MINPNNLTSNNEKGNCVMTTTINDMLKKLNACESTYTNARAAGWTIPNAIKRAQTRKTAWDKKDFKTAKMPANQTTYNPKDDEKCRWIENISIDLRIVGYADEIVKSINHMGYFVNEYQDEVLRGQVIQLPSRNKKQQYVGGYEDPCNDDHGYFDFSRLFDNAQDAALHANGFAEYRAEKERDYQMEESAKSIIEEKEDEIFTAREQIIALCSELRKARKIAENAELTSLCAQLKRDVKEELSRVRRLQSEIEKLKNDPYEVIY